MSYHMLQFCDNLSPGNFTDIGMDIYKLVKSKQCPEYLLPSTPVMGRCVPTVSLMTSQEAEREQPKLDIIEKLNGEPINMENVLKGTQYVVNSISTQEKLFFNLSYNWWILFLYFLLDMVLSFMMLKLPAKPVIWSTIISCIVILLSGCISSFNQLNTTMEDLNISDFWYDQHDKITWLVLGIVLFIVFCFVFLNLCGLTSQKIKEAVNLIGAVSKIGFASSLAVYLITFIQSVIQILFIAMGVTIEMCLLNSSLWLQALNLCATLWFMGMVQRITYKVIDGLFNDWNQTLETPELAKKMPFREVMKSLKKTAYGMLRIPCIEELRNLKTLPYEILQHFKNKPDVFSSVNNWCEQGVFLILAAAKVSIIGLVLAASFVTYSYKASSSLEVNLNNPLLPILTAITGTFLITSGNFKVYSITVNRMIN